GLDEGLRLWDAQTGKELRQLRPSSQLSDHVAVSVSACLTFSPDGKLLAEMDSEQNAVRLWDIIAGKEISAFVGHAGDINGLWVEPKANELATCSADRTIRYWDLTTGKQQRQLSLPNEAGPTVFSPDGRLIAFSTEKRNIHLWDAAMGKELRR